MVGAARRPLVGAVAGAVVGAVVVGVLAVNDFAFDEELTPATTSESQEAADAFLAAWERKLRGTWVARSEFTRTTATRQTLSGEVHEAQRPPDRVRRGLGSVDARIDGRRLACAPTETGEVQCRDGGPAPPYEDEVASELGLLRGYVMGRARLYAVSAESSTCFRLRLVQRMLAPPYGAVARFCFQAATGAPLRAEIRRNGTLDVTRALEVGADPTPADLAPEESGRREPG